MKRFLLVLLLVPSLVLALPRGVKITTATTSGQVAIGARFVELIFSSDFAGTVQGVAFAGGDAPLVFQALPNNDTYGPIAYTRSAGSIRIVEVR